jgi:hypothetical protein
MQTYDWVEVNHAFLTSELDDDDDDDDDDGCWTSRTDRFIPDNHWMKTVDRNVFELGSRRNRKYISPLLPWQDAMGIHYCEPWRLATMLVREEVK